jgi:hypothetical protein
VAIIYDSKDEVHVLMAEGVPAGFAELVPVHRQRDRPSIRPRATVPGVSGCTPAARTCPAALLNYSKAGTVIYQEKIKDPG